MCTLELRLQLRRLLASLYDLSLEPVHLVCACHTKLLKLIMLDITSNSSSSF